MSDIVYVQGVMTRDALEALKEKTGKTNTKDALDVAVTHYMKNAKKGGK